MASYRLFWAGSFHRQRGTFRVPFTIRIVPSARDELKAIRKFDRATLIRAIDEQCAALGRTKERNRKVLAGATPAFGHEPPVWELRVGEYRIFYDVNSDGEIVFIRAVREKPPHRTTG